MEAGASASATNRNFVLRTKPATTTANCDEGRLRKSPEGSLLGPIELRRIERKIPGLKHSVQRADSRLSRGCLEVAIAIGERRKAVMQSFGLYTSPTCPFESWANR